MHLDNSNTQKVRLDTGKQNGMVLHHHLDKNKKISSKLNVDQVALRLDQLDSIRSRSDDRISDCRQTLNIDKNGKDNNRINIDKEIDIDKNLISNPDRYFYELDYSKQNRNLDKYLDKKNKNSLCKIDKSREGRLPHYLMNLVFRIENNECKSVPIMARLDSLADVNWISKKLFLDLKSKYKIDIYPCNIACKLVDKSEIKLDQCCNLELSILMKNNSRLKISCRFVVIDSENDLVLGWHAINRFNLMKVNVASNLKCNLNTTKTKNIQFKPD